LRSGVFEPPIGGLRGKVGDSSIPRWKAPYRLPISDKGTFSVGTYFPLSLPKGGSKTPLRNSAYTAAVTAEELQAEISPIQRFIEVVRHFVATFEVEVLMFPPISTV